MKILMIFIAILILLLLLFVYSAFVISSQCSREEEKYMQEDDKE